MSPSAFEDHLLAPRGRGRLSDGPHAGAAGGAACGDLVRITVAIEADRIVDAGFDASGCGAAQAAASAAIELVAGAPLLEAARLGADEVAAALGGLLPAKRHAAALAAEALHRALGAAAAADAELTPAADRTLVAMSGGVDSAVAAHLARAGGDDVVAVTLELWSDPANDGERSCCSPQAVSGARALAHAMGLPHLTLDLREAFRREVVDDFVREHAAGRTPNPCVRCNGQVRFEEMLALATRLGAGRLATGHYARIARDDDGPLLAAAADANKDQTYMLARLDPDALGRLHFPLAGRTKPQVRELARRAGLPVADRPESQDLCFLAGVGKRGFLRAHEGAGPPAAAGADAKATQSPPPAGASRGEIVSLSGEVLGHHEGQRDYTVGQRRGLALAAPEPLYVLSKNAARERVTVGPRSALATTSVELEGAVLHRDGDRVQAVKLRYRSVPVKCRVEGAPRRGAHASLSLTLAQPVDGVAPGQTACLLAGDRVVGCATIG
jgi:tRNA-specific 2-thiouridylase